MYTYSPGLFVFFFLSLQIAGAYCIFSGIVASFRDRVWPHAILHFGACCSPAALQCHDSSDAAPRQLRAHTASS